MIFRRILPTAFANEKSLRIIQRAGYRFDVPTKGQPVAKMLDIYARRDPQLAPYLLREVNIEYKRKNTKVRFVFWAALAVLLLMLDQRLNAELIHHMRRYLEVVQMEEDEKDLDADIRRAKLVAFLGAVRRSFERDRTWNDDDTAKAIALVKGVMPEPASGSKLESR